MGIHYGDFLWGILMGISYGDFLWGFLMGIFNCTLHLDYRNKKIFTHETFPKLFGEIIETEDRGLLNLFT